MTDEQRATEIKKIVQELNTVIENATVAGLSVKVDARVKYTTSHERECQMFNASVYRPL